MLAYNRFGQVKRAMWRDMRDESEADPQPVSIIIAARNEAPRLENHLKLVLNQKHPNFEVIVADDGSTDGTNAYLQELQVEHPHLKVLHLQAMGKKSALQAAVEVSSYPNLLFTDADCAPASLNWATLMSSAFKAHDLVLGYGALEGGGVISRLALFETFQTVILYYSAALNSRAYMGVGRNIGYTKALFLKQGGHQKHAHLKSGDDDLFVSSLKKSRTKVVFDSQSFTVSEAPTSLNSWWKQKRRHYSTAFHYPSLRKWMLGLEGSAQLLFYLFLPVALIYFPKPSLFFLLMRYAAGLVWAMPLARHFKAAKAWAIFPVYEMLWALFTAIIHFQNAIFGTRKAW